MGRTSGSQQEGAAASDPTHRESYQAMDGEVSRMGDAAEARSVDDPVQPCELHWIELECFRDDGTPMANLPFILRRESGAPLWSGTTEVRGKLDDQGWARIVRIDTAKDCILEFPEVEDGLILRPMYPGFWDEVAEESSSD
ncbi:MAG: hypothetical protein KDD47_20000 [Acidobacteria bacterium]|nr:hypothetical protein [Acidobacteriota bacterium]